MESFTFGSDKGHEAVIRANEATGENYPITLNRRDFAVLTELLREVALYGEITRHKLNELLDHHVADDADPIEDWAWSWYSGIAETLGVELI